MKWHKYQGNPVLSSEEWGTLFDPFVLQNSDKGFRMYVSWRPQNAIAALESTDGVHWSAPRIVLGSFPRSDLREHHINRACVLSLPSGGYRMYYSGQGPDFKTPKHACIFAAESDDGFHWKRLKTFIFSPDGEWQKFGVMCPHVLYDAETQRYKMWYSGMNNPGACYEPDAIGYAESADGLAWTLPFGGPVFRAEQVASPKLVKVTAAQVIKAHGWYYMFYIGFKSDSLATICLCRSRTGVDNWEQHPDNPIVSPDENRWDHDACYKPSVCVANGKCLLWYNGRKGNPEQIGLALKDSEDYWM